VVWIEEVGWVWDLTSDFAFVFEGSWWNLFSVAEIQWKAGFAAGTTEGDEVVVGFSLESFDHPTNEVRGGPRFEA
jgi:hypothetical protein